MHALCVRTRSHTCSLCCLGTATTRLERLRQGAARHGSTCPMTYRRGPISSCHATSSMHTCRRGLCIAASPTRHALERVEVAHATSYQYPTFRASNNSSSVSYNNAYRNSDSSSSGGSSSNCTTSSVYPTHASAVYSDEANHSMPGSTNTSSSSSPISSSSSSSPMNPFTVVSSRAPLELRCLPIAEAEYLYFGSAVNEQWMHKKERASTLHCALCDMDLENGVSPRFHIFGSSRASHTNHTCREVLLDSLALLGMRGFPLDSIYHVWSDILYQHPLYSRVRNLTSPNWTLERRARQLSRLLLTLREMQIIDVALAVRSVDQSLNRSRRRLSFERIEYIGDNSWGTNISSRMMLLFPNEQWQYSERCFSFNVFRDACEMNIMLNVVFDALHLRKLFSGASEESLCSGKSKADVVEAILGELHLETFGRQPAMYDDSPFIEINGVYSGRVCAVVQHCLTEMYDLIVLFLARELMATALPMAKKVAASYLWMRSHLSVFRSRHRRPELHERKPPMSPPLSHMSSALASSASSPSLRGANRHALEKSERAHTGAASDTQEDVTGASCAATTKTTDASAAAHSSGDSRNSSDLDTSATHSTRCTTGLLHSSATRTFVLPALPYLAPAPHRYPRRLPHPLLASPTGAATHDIQPACTVSAYTGKDVFAAFRQSFDRLGLITDDARQFICVLHAPPRLDKLARQLVPGLTLDRSCMTVARNCASPDCSLARRLPMDEEEGDEHDPASSTGSHVSKPSLRLTGTSSLHISAEESAATTLLPSEESCQTSDTSWNVLSMDEHDYYCVDPYYALATEPQVASSAAVATSSACTATITRRTASSLASSSAAKSAHMEQHSEHVKPPIEVALCMLHPKLSSTAPVSHSGGSRTAVETVHGWPAELFARSHWVEESVKPPVAGVVTEKNLARGRFAFLGYGYRDHHRRTAAQLCLRGPGNSNSSSTVGCAVSATVNNGSSSDSASTTEDGSAQTPIDELAAVEEECQRMRYLAGVRAGVTTLLRTLRVPPVREESVARVQESSGTAQGKAEGGGEAERDETAVVDLVATTQFWSTLIRRRRSNRTNPYFLFLK